MKKVSVLITGLPGQVATDILDYLYNEKTFKITAIYRNKNNLKNKYKKVSWKMMDLSENINLKSQFDIIINCIAVHNFSRNREIGDYYKSNVLVIRNLSDFAKKNKIKYIINLSTISIYGNIKDKVLSENYKPLNPDILGITKNAGEKILEHSNIKFLNLRLPGVLCKKKNSSRPWLSSVIKKFQDNKKIEVFNKDSVFNNVIDTKEIVRFILFVINKKNFNKTFNYNFSSVYPVKVSYITNLIRKFYNSKSKLIFKKINSRNSFTISNNKIKKIFKFTPVSTKEIILRNL